MFRFGFAAAALLGLAAGTGYVDGFSDATDKITFTFAPESAGLHDVELIYNGPYGDKYTYVVFNGAGGSQVSLPATTNWMTVSAGQVMLTAGNNTIEIQNNWGWYLIDAITLAPSAERGPHKVTTTPVNSDANADAKGLLSYLGSIYGKNILSGQQDQTSLDWVTQNVGKTPAILGSDLMDYTESRTSRGASSQDVEHSLAFAKKGGIVAMVWHWGAPTGLYDTAERPWYSGFYTDATSFNIETALADTTNANYTLLIKDIDTIAIQLKKLQDAGVAVLWRPLHEAEGGWFWWGAQGPEPCKKLYKILYDRLTNYHKLNNLVWVWNSIAPAWYPGDDVVDIVSADTYAQGDHGPQSATYNSLLKLTNDTKIIAATEVGSVMEPAQLQAYQADWVYFCVWGGEYISGGEWNSLDLLKEVYADENRFKQERKTMAEAQRPKVGVGVIIHDEAGNIVMGERAGSHGAGTLQCPGGHLEYGESFAETAAREVLEETGLIVGNIKFLTATNDVFGEGKHYVTIFVTCTITGENKVPQPMEPHKCAAWQWIPWGTMWTWAGEQAQAEKEGREVQRKMFLPLVNLWREYPDLKNVL
ncbi:glycoside hydrolase family 26 protein [Stemphylium lycopersici]|uniref:Glycoside hydrolase family 26 protein n=1 Tax=Stemphylium lycopersici TaxID=183478 RepID=A0A364NCK5_STELY|nr:glycoside hydrolase family 26 protein [Stemphylium lycopersici]